jgi:hypothetical protein
MDNQQFARVKFLSAILQLDQRDTGGIVHGTGLEFAALPNVEDRDVVLLLRKQLNKLLHRNLRNVIEFVTARNPTRDAVFEISLYVINADASQAQL